jgi:hypothetical protein
VAEVEVGGMARVLDYMGLTPHTACWVYAIASDLIYAEGPKFDGVLELLRDVYGEEAVEAAVDRVCRLESEAENGGK